MIAGTGMLSLGKNVAWRTPEAGPWAKSVRNEANGVNAATTAGSFAAGVWFVAVFAFASRTLMDEAAEDKTSSTASAVADILIDDAE
jgi:hypothetical protein